MLVVLKNKDAARDVPGRRFERAAPPLLWPDDSDSVDAMRALSARDDVASVLPGVPAYPLASRALDASDHVVKIGDVEVGGSAIVVMAGPCSVENAAQISEAAADVARAGASVLRGGAFKPRTSPYAFAGTGETGLRYMKDAAKKSGLFVVTEVMDPRDIELVATYADCLQVGARNMQNFALLRALGEAGKPVLLKRGFGCTIEETLNCAEYILAAGNPNVILCERGIRTFEGATRFTFDVAAIALFKKRSRLPVIADPSHAAGEASLVGDLARSAIAAGADGLLVEVHPTPEQALSDKDQALTPLMFSRMMDSLEPLAAAMGRHLPRKRALRRTS